MKIKGLYIAAALGSALALPAPALAQETGNISALLAMRTYSNDGGVFMYKTDGLADLESCLQVGWASSQAIPDLAGIGVTVTCLQNGRVIGGQSCYKGKCTGLSMPPAPGTRP